jgi:hypothetical protein
LKWRILLPEVEKKLVERASKALKMKMVIQDEKTGMEWNRVLVVLDFCDVQFSGLLFFYCLRADSGAVTPMC